MDVSPQEIESLRSAFLQTVEASGESAYHPTDLNRVRKDDQWLSRFLLHCEKDQAVTITMMKESLEWRKSFKVNEISEQTVRMDYMVEGGFFPRGRDKDGCALLIFKCKKHVKGSKDMDEVKRCVIYWMERMERQEKGKQITIFFDLEGCGLGNMDMDFTKYIIALFKQYYPYFLNYIIIYEMSWILNAAINVIKSLLPPKAVQKIQMLKKASILTFVPEDQALKCWGGKDDYVFSFVPETREQTKEDSVVQTPSNKKVHFAAEHGDQMNDSNVSWDKETVGDGGVLSITPSTLLSFTKDGDEYVSVLEIKNTDPKQNISYKLKTNAPQKFRVRPSAGVLAPGDSANISIYLLPAYQVSGLSRDKFLVMSVPVNTNHMSTNELGDLWKNTSDNVTQHRLRCAQLSNERDMSRNGSAVQIPNEGDQLVKLTASVTQLQECQSKLHKSIAFAQMLQIINLILLLVIAFVLMYAMRASAGDELPLADDASAGCYHSQEL
ncbi:motile sperm domain-containing protein 2-like [Atheta coriaria]|uniref:motile sperm domain-containing protein 2-like n=1 Tax=Dalotia coriaria TaxID=877792 RepID=UPI0031F36F34